MFCFCMYKLQFPDLIYGFLICSLIVAYNFLFNKYYINIIKCTVGYAIIYNYIDITLVCIANAIHLLKKWIHHHHDHGCWFGMDQTFKVLKLIFIKLKVGLVIKSSL